MYAALGWIVWHGGKIYVRRRYGNRPKQIAAGVILVGGIGAALAAQKRAGDGA